VFKNLGQDKIIVNHLAINTIKLYFKFVLNITINPKKEAKIDEQDE